MAKNERSFITAPSNVELCLYRPTEFGESNKGTHEQREGVEVARVAKLGIVFPLVLVDPKDSDQIVAEITGAIGDGHESGALLVAVAVGGVVRQAIRKRPNTLETGRNDVLDISGYSIRRIGMERISESRSEPRS